MFLVIYNKKKKKKKKKKENKKKKKKKMCKHTVKKLPSVIRYVPDRYKTQQMCDKTILENDRTF